MTWPHQSPAAMNAFYGNPDADGDGAPDPAWAQANLVFIEPPYPMFYAGSPVRRITVHRLCADSLKRILERIGARFSPEERARLQLDQFGGVYNFRLKRGGSTLSIHSWGAAIDLAPALNGFGVTYDETRGMMPMTVVEIFEAEGWEWGGLWSNPDAMHFQAARTGRGHGGRVPVPPPPQPTRDVKGWSPLGGGGSSGRFAPEDDGGGGGHGGGPVDPLVRLIQQALLDKGYAMVGRVDGRHGKNTRAAIRAFEDEHGLPDKGEPTAELLAQILAAAPRPVSEMREAATPAEVRAAVPEVKAAWWSKIAGQLVAGVSGLGMVGGWAIEHVVEIKAQAQPVLQLFGDVPGWAYALVLAGVGGWLWWQSRKGEAAGVAAFKAGERR